MQQTPLEFFETKYPDDAREDQRKYLGRFGVSGKMQVQKMAELSDGQKSRVVFAKLGRDVPHILLLDVSFYVVIVYAVSNSSCLQEPTNHLDMESIDALAKAINEFDGGMVLVSHDMRLISQVAKEIWICDKKAIEVYKGDIQKFKMTMRAQLGLQGEQKQQLRGDFSVKKGEEKSAAKKPEPKPKEARLEPEAKASEDHQTSTSEQCASPDVSAASESKTPSTLEVGAPRGRYIPPHLRKKMQEQQQ